MSHVLPPAAGESGWKRLLKLEPAIVKGLIGLLVSLGLIWGVDLTSVGDQLSQTADVVGSIIALLTPLWIRTSVTPDAKVVASVDTHGTVVAGAASPLPTGTVVDPTNPLA